MKGIYIYQCPIEEDNSKQFVGILKKVYAQYEVFKKNITTDFDLINLKRNYNKNPFVRFFAYLFFSNVFDYSDIKDKKYDYVYIRRINPNCRSIICMLKQLRKINPNCKILYEIPTYPYDFEHKGFLGKIQLIIDKVFRKKLYLYVDKIVIITDEEKIFGCKTLKISNGVDVNSIPICSKKEFDSQNISLIAVAQFAFWHAYERVIEGLYQYYKKGGASNIVLHLIGNGAELQKYKDLVNKYKLNEFVIFHGALFGDQLSDVFNKADIAISSLGCHRINIFTASALKTREYFCRGLPIITSTKVDIIPDDFKYALRVPEDDTPIDIDRVIDFAKNVYINKETNQSDRVVTTKMIRKFAENNCSMESAMKNVINYFSDK